MPVPGKFLRLLLCLVCAGATSACVVLAGGAMLGGAIVATDRRSVGMQVEDVEIEHRINHAFEDRFARESVRIDVTSFNQNVLLAGQVPNEKARADAQALAAIQQNVHQVTSELTIGSLAGLNSQMDDDLLAGKVRAALLDVPGLGPGVTKVACTDAVIYLFGRVTTTEADLAKRASSHVNGVKRVVALFDIVSESDVQSWHGEPPAARPLSK
jgi:osmotically-inducible protein OsmY